MDLDRVDLADIHDPVRLASAVHRQMGRLTGAVPVIDIAHGLDIEEVRQEVLDGCEGTLLTDRVRSCGKILVNNRHGPRRARFSIAHELGHFLLERHQLHGEDGFICRGRDMRERRRDDAHRRQETEANTFAIGLLAPPYLMAEALREDPDLRVAGRLARKIDISLEAAIRRYVDLHDEPLAAVWTTAGLVRSFALGARFPYLDLSKGDRLCRTSRAASVVGAGTRGVTSMSEARPLAWLRDPDADLSEQTRVGRDGHAVTLLWATADDDPDEDELEQLGKPGFRARQR